MDGQITAIAEDDRVGIFAIAVITDGTTAILIFS